MFNPTLSQRIWHKLHLKTTKIRSLLKKRQLTNLDFTIISNNCWGGLTYEEYGLRKNSPTVGGVYLSCGLFAFCRQSKRIFKQTFATNLSFAGNAS